MPEAWLQQMIVFSSDEEKVHRCEVLYRRHDAFIFVLNRQKSSLLFYYYLHIQGPPLDRQREKFLARSDGSCIPYMSEQLYAESMRVDLQTLFGRENLAYVKIRRGNVAL